jgi:hypothetical protein
MNETEYAIDNGTVTLNTVQYVYAETILQMNLGGKLRGNFHMQAKGDYLNRVDSDQIVLKIVRRGG